MDAALRQTSEVDIWSGSVDYSELGSFKATVFAISEGGSETFAEGVKKSLKVVGRVQPASVKDYMTKTRWLAQNRITIVGIRPVTDGDQDNYIKLFQHFMDKDRYGVVQSESLSVKNIYLVPLPAKTTLPEGMPQIRERSLHTLLAICINSNKDSLHPEKFVKPSIDAISSHSSKTEQPSVKENESIRLPHHRNSKQDSCNTNGGISLKYSNDKHSQQKSSVDDVEKLMNKIDSNRRTKNKRSEKKELFLKDENAYKRLLSALNKSITDNMLSPNSSPIPSPTKNSNDSSQVHTKCDANNLTNASAQNTSHVNSVSHPSLSIDQFKNTFHKLPSPSLPSPSDTKFSRVNSLALSTGDPYKQPFEKTIFNYPSPSVPSCSASNVSQTTYLSVTDKFEDSFKFTYENHVHKSPSPSIPNVSPIKYSGDSFEITENTGRKFTSKSASSPNGPNISHANSLAPSHTDDPFEINIESTVHNSSMPSAPSYIDPNVSHKSSLPSSSNSYDPFEIPFENNVQKSSSLSAPNVSQRSSLLPASHSNDPFEITFDNAVYKSPSPSVTSPSCPNISQNDSLPLSSHSDDPFEIIFENTVHKSPSPSASKISHKNSSSSRHSDDEITFVKIVNKSPSFNRPTTSSSLSVARSGIPISLSGGSINQPFTTTSSPFSIITSLSDYPIVSPTVSPTKSNGSVTLPQTTTSQIFEIGKSFLSTYSDEYNLSAAASDIPSGGSMIYYSNSEIPISSSTLSNTSIVLSDISTSQTTNFFIPPDIPKDPPSMNATCGQSKIPISNQRRVSCKSLESLTESVLPDTQPDFSSYQSRSASDAETASSTFINVQRNNSTTHLDILSPVSRHLSADLNIPNRHSAVSTDQSEKVSSSSAMFPRILSPQVHSRLYSAISNDDVEKVGSKRTNSSKSNSSCGSPTSTCQLKDADESTNCKYNNRNDEMNECYCRKVKKIKVSPLQLQLMKLMKLQFEEHQQVLRSYPCVSDEVLH